MYAGHLLRTHWPAMQHILINMHSMSAPTPFCPPSPPCTHSPLPLPSCESATMYLHSRRPTDVVESCFQLTVRRSATLKASLPCATRGSCSVKYSSLLNSALKTAAAKKRRAAAMESADRSGGSTFQPPCPLKCPRYTVTRRVIALRPVAWAPTVQRLNCTSVHSRQKPRQPTCMSPSSLSRLLSCPLC